LCEFYVLNPKNLGKVAGSKSYDILEQNLSKRAFKGSFSSFVQTLAQGILGAVRRKR